MSADWGKKTQIRTESLIKWYIDIDNKIHIIYIIHITLCENSHNASFERNPTQVEVCRKFEIL